MTFGIVSVTAVTGKTLLGGLYRTASMRYRACRQQTFVQPTDVNWTVTVIIKLRLPPKLIMTPRIPPPAHRRRRGLLWRVDTNFRR